MIFKIEFQVLGGHTHFRLRAGTTEGSLGLCAGDLAMLNEEFEAFRAILEDGAVLQSETVLFQEIK